MPVAAPAVTPPLTEADHAAIDEILSAPVPSIVVPAAVAAPLKSEDIATTSAERSALEGVSAALDARADAGLAAGPSTSATSLPAYLLPLAWISAPLSLFPAGIRELIGKVAIVTLFNAVAVFIYLMLFRHH